MLLAGGGVGPEGEQQLPLLAKRDPSCVYLPQGGKKGEENVAVISGCFTAASAVNRAVVVVANLANPASPPLRPVKYPNLHTEGRPNSLFFARVGGQLLN